MGLYDDFKFSATRDTQDDSKSNRWFSGVALDDEPTAEPAVEQKDSGLISGSIDAVGEGFKSMTRAVRSFGNMTVGDNAEVEELAAVKAKQSNEQQAFTKGYADRNAAEKDAGLLDYIGNFAAAAWENPTGAVHATAEQFANAIPTLGAGYAGAKAGALAGGALGGGVGALPGAIVGGFLGMALGNTAIEGGYKGMQAAEGGLTDAESSQALREGAIKGTVIAGVDMATLGLGGAAMKTIGKTAVKAGAMAEAKVLMDAGVNVADKAALEAALRIPDLAKAAQAAGQVAAREALGAGAKAAKAGVGLSLETVGEGVGEYMGEVAATGKGDLADAVMEGFMGAGQSSIETAYNYNKTQGNEMALKGLLEAGSTDEAISYFNALQANLARPTEEAIGETADPMAAFHASQQSQRPTDFIAGADGVMAATPGNLAAQEAYLASQAPLRTNPPMANLTMDQSQALEGDAAQTDLAPNEVQDTRTMPTARDVNTPNQTPVDEAGQRAMLNQVRAEVTAGRPNSPIVAVARQRIGDAAVDQQIQRVTASFSMDKQEQVAADRAATVPIQVVSNKTGTHTITFENAQQAQAVTQALTDAGVPMTKTAGDTITVQRKADVGQVNTIVSRLNTQFTEPRVQDDILTLEGTPSANQTAAPSMPEMQGQTQPSRPVPAEQNINTLPLLGSSKIISRTKAKALQQIGRLTGTTIKFFHDKNDTSAEGFFRPKEDPNVVYINTAKPDLTMRRVFGHEVTHQLRTKHPKAWAEIEKVVRATMKPDTLVAMAEDYFSSKKDIITKLTGYKNQGKAEDFLKLTTAEAGYGQRFNDDNTEQTVEQLLMDEMVSDLGGNRFGEEAFWEQVFQNIIEKEGTEKGKGIIQRLMDSVIKMIKAFNAMMRDQNFKADELVDVDQVRTAMANAYATMIMENRGRDVGGELDASLGDETITQERALGGSVDAKESTRRDRTSESITNSDRSGVIVGAKPGAFGWTPQSNVTLWAKWKKGEAHGPLNQGDMPPPFGGPTQRTPNQSIIGEAVFKILKSKGAQSVIGDLLKANNVELAPNAKVEVLPTQGSWLGQPERSFKIVGLSFKQSDVVSKLLGFAIAQDMAIVTEPVANPNDDTDVQPGIALGNGQKFDDTKLKPIIEAAQKEGIDYTLATDGYTVQFGYGPWLPFSESEFIDKVGRIAAATGMTSQAYEARSKANFAGSYNNEIERITGVVQGERNTDATRGPSDLFTRTVDHILIPYARAVGGQGYRFSPDLFAERFNLGNAEREYIRAALRPKNGYVRSTAKIVSEEELAGRELKDGEELMVPGKSAGTEKNPQTNNSDVFWALQNRVALTGLIEPGDYSPEALKVISQAIEDEIAYHVARPEGKSAIGWYDEALAKAKKIYHQVFPELDTNADREMLFDALLGITSQGNDVHANSVFAGRMYYLITRENMTISQAQQELTGTFGKEFNAIENNFLKLEQLLKANGYDRLRKLMNKKQTVGEWNAELRADKTLHFNGKAMKMSGAARQMVKGWMVFGPKIGSFINNLHGDYSTLTADLWYSRTWNRILGFSFLHTPMQEAPKYQAFKEAMIAEYEKTTEARSINDKGEREEWDHGDDLKNVSAFRLDSYLADPDEMLRMAQEFEYRFRTGADFNGWKQKGAKGYHIKSDLRRAAKNWIEFREDAVALPRNDNERAFQQDVMEAAQKLLKKRHGVTITIADMQAALWYHEKELFGKFGAGDSKAEPADYADAADNFMKRYNEGDLFYVEKPTPRYIRGTKGSYKPKAPDTGPQFSEARSDASSDQVNGAGNAAPVRTGKSGSVSGVGIHYSKVQQKALISSFFGSGAKAAELERVMQSDDPRIKHRIYFYVNTGRGINQEFGVGPHAHKADLSNLYDMSNDPLDLWVGRTPNAFESAVLDAGFDGVISQDAGIAILLGQRVLNVEYLGMGVKPTVDQAGKAEASQYQKDLKAVAANMLLPSGQMKGSEWKTMVAKRMPSIDVSHLNDDEKYYKSGIVRKPMVQFSPSRAVDTNSPKFRKWFGDSKVVDADGKPLRVYHGTPNDFSDFDPDLSVEGGFFFTVDKDHASNFSGYKGTLVKPKNANVMPVHLSIQNPMVVSGRSIPKFHSVEDIENLINKAKAGRHDGVLIKNFNDGGAGKADNYIAFKPTQIKSALSNTGEYSDTNPDIRFSPSRELDFTQPDNMTLADMWLKLSEDADKSFIYKRTDEKDMVKLLNTLIPKAGAQEMESWFDSKLKPGQHLYRIDVKGKDAFVWVDDNRKEVWIDVSPLKGEGLGGQVYNAAANWAFNNDYVFVGDPYSISPAGMKRRIEHMVSSALKFRTSKHLAANEFMRNWFEEKIGKPLNDKNLQGWLEASYDMVKKDVPEAEDIVYNVKEKRYEWAEDGEAVGEGVIDAIAERTRGKIGAGSPGNRTLQKVFLSNTLLRGGDQGRALAEELRGGSRVLEGLDRKVLFSPSRVVDARDQSVPQIWYRGQVGAKAAEGPFDATAIGSPSFADSPEVASVYAMNPEAAGLYGINQRPQGYADNSNVAPYKITGKLYDARSLQGGHGTKTGLTPKAVRRVLKDLGLGENDVMIDFAGKYGRGKSAFWDAAEYDIPESRKILAAHTLFDQPAVREVLEEKGYAGVIFNGSLSEQNTRNDVPWDEAIVHGELRAVKKGSLQSAISPDILYSPPRFFSQLERSVDQIPKKLTTGKEIALWLKGNAGKLQVKKEELEWTAVLDWLDTQKKVSSDDIKNFLAHNGVQVQDVVLGGETGLTSAQKERLDELENNGDRTNEEDAEFQRLIRIENDADGKTDDTKFSQYQLEGDKSDYRELLITLPVSAEKERNYKNGLISRSEFNEGQFFANHYPETGNILAHLRFSTRTDAQGRSVMFIEEVQSDFGQTGEDKGFVGQKPIDEARVSDIKKKLADEQDADKRSALARTLDKLEKRIAKNDYSTPTSPFVTDTNAWTALALKRALMWAVQNGHDAVAFTTGAQQAERYDLSKQVDEIIFWGPDADGDITPDADEVGISIYGKGGAAIKEQEIVKHSDLEDLIGKELAQRIIDGDAPQAEGQPQGVKTLSGLDLKVGGTGMIAYYDRILPDTLRKVLRQVGAGDTAVEQIVMERGHEMEHPETGETVETQDETQPGIILSDKLKEAVSAGVPLFSLPRNLQGQPINAAWSNDLNLEPWDYVKRQLLDKLKDTKDILGEIRKAGVAIKDAFDPYLQETLYHGRAAKGVADFAESELKPLIAEMHLKGIEMQELEDYLWARHAGERNAQVASIGGMADGGSGLTNAEAAAILSGQAVTKNGRTIQIRTAKMPAYQTLAQKVKAINDSTLDLLVAEGLETQATVNAWKAAYSNYVPLKRDMESDDNFLGAFNLGSGTGQGFSVKGSASKRALGSNRAVIDILANVAMQRERAIVRAEKNKIAMATYGLALTAPNPEFWIPINPKGDVTDIVDQLVKMGVAPQQARQYADNLAQQPTTQTVNSQGVVTSTPMPFLAQRPDVMSVRVNGEDRFLMFSSDEKGQQMVRNLKNLDAEQMGVVMSNIAKVTRYFAAINTAYNPIFGLTNFIRDSGSALLNLSSTPLAGKQGEVAGNVTSALRGVFSDLRAHRDGRPATSVWAQEFEEFQKEGGQTGYMDSFSNSTERAKAIRDELTSLDKSKWLKLGDKNPVLGLLSDYNTAIENAWRLSAYKVAKQSGMSKQQAAALAKSLTVNFNRKGLAATQLGALFAFFNAAVQGSARIAETMVKDGKLTPAGQKIILGGLIAGSAQALMFAAAGWDDEEPPQFIREKNFIIPLANGKYVAIPYPLGYHVIPNLGRVSTEFVLGGFKKPADRIIQLAMSVVDGFNPLGSSSIAQTIAPTIADPIIAMAENKDFTGKNIFKEDFNKMKPTAGWTRTKDTASDLAKGLSYGINYATGGGKYGIGALSPTPDQIDYLIGQATGGVGREANKLYQAGKTVVSGEELPEYKIPVAGRFYGSTTGQASQASRFYSNLKMIGQHASTVKEMTEAKDFDSRSEYLKEHAAATMIDRADKVSREIGYLKRMKREAIENGDSEKVKQLESRITTKMALFNDVVKAKVK